MLEWILIALVVAAVAGLLGFAGISSAAWTVARILIAILLIGIVLLLVFGVLVFA